MSLRLTTAELDALAPGALVRCDEKGMGDPRHLYQKTDPPGPNGPWRRPAEGVDAGRWVTTRSSTLALMGVVRA